jgi:hypothetical protein
MANFLDFRCAFHQSSVTLADLLQRVFERFDIVLTGTLLYSFKPDPGRDFVDFTGVISTHIADILCVLFAVSSPV